MRYGLARAGGGLAVALSIFLLALVLGTGVGLNVANGWTIFFCGLGGLFALEVRLIPAASLLIVGATPAIVGGVGYLFVPSLLLIALSAVAPRSSAPHPAEQAEA